MAEALVVPTKSAAERTPLRARLSATFYRARAAVLGQRWAIKKEMRDTSRFYTRALADPKARKASRDDIESLRAEAAHFHWELEEKLEMWESNRLLRQADDYLIKTPDLPRDPNDPDGDPNWRIGTTYKPHLYLTRPAMHDLRTKIRAERKARREPYAEWIKIIGGLGGVTFLVKELAGLVLR